MLNVFIQTKINKWNVDRLGKWNLILMDLILAKDDLISKYHRFYNLCICKSNIANENNRIWCYLWDLINMSFDVYNPTCLFY